MKEVGQVASGFDPLYTVIHMYRIHATNQFLKKLTTYIIGMSY